MVHTEAAACGRWQQLATQQALITAAVSETMGGHRTNITFHPDTDHLGNVFDFRASPPQLHLQVSKHNELFDHH